MSKRTPIARLRAARLLNDEPDDVSGYWRGYFIWVELEPMGDWYMRVEHPNGSYLVDGWWQDSAGRSADEAVARAFEGACLLEGKE